MQALDLTQGCMFTTVLPRLYSAPSHTIYFWTLYSCTSKDWRLLLIALLGQYTKDSATKHDGFNIR